MGGIILTHIDISGILHLHLDTLTNFRTKKLDFANVALFILLPISIGALVAFGNHRIGVVETIALTLFLSIVGAALIGLLVTLPAVFGGDGTEPEMERVRKQLLFETRSIIAFSVLIVLMTTTVLLTAQVPMLKYLVVSVAYALTTKYVLTAFYDLIAKHRMGEPRSPTVANFCAVAFLFVTAACLMFIRADNIFGYMVVGITYFLNSTLILNLLVIIKRIHVLVGKERGLYTLIDRAR